MRTWILTLALLVSACAPRHAAVTSATPINPATNLIGNDGGSLITNDGASIIGNDGAGVIGAQNVTLAGKLAAPRAADAVDASDTLITLGTGGGKASTSMDALPVAGATVTVREVRTLTAIATQKPQLTNNQGRFAVGALPATTTILFEAAGPTGDGKTLRLLGIFAKDESVSLDLASTLAAVRALAPGQAATSARGSVKLGPVKAAIASALTAHPREALAAARLLATDDNAPFAFGSIKDLEDALVTLGKADTTLQGELNALDATLD